MYFEKTEAKTHGEMVREVRSDLNTLHRGWRAVLGREKGSEEVDFSVLTGDCPELRFTSIPIWITAFHNFLSEIRGVPSSHGTEKRFFASGGTRSRHEKILARLRFNYDEVLHPELVAP